MYKLKASKPLVQATGIITAVLILVTGVTYAALQSQQVALKNNSIVTGLASLSLSVDNIVFSNSINGYTFGGLIPGGSPVPTIGHPVYIRNDGNTALALKLSVDAALSNPDAVDLSKVHVIISPVTGGVPQNISLQSLRAPGGVALTGGSASHQYPGSTVGFLMQVSMDGDAVTGSSANLTNVIFNFDGSAVN